jgi:hypothetical protein
MKTKPEIEQQAARLQQSALTLAPVSVEQSPVAPSAPTPLFVFPETTFRANVASEFEGPLTFHFSRFVSGAPSNGETEFKLFEKEWVSNSNGETVRESGPFEIVSRDDAYEALVAGYQRLDEDRLRERIEPVIDRMESSTFPEEPSSEKVAEIENFASEFSLSASARMRLKIDAAAMLEGRLDAGEFIVRTVARQECFEAKQTCQISNQITEAIEI